MPNGNEVRGRTAQERAQKVLGAVKTIESIGEKQKAERSGRTKASNGVSGFMKRFRHEPEPVVNHATALKLAGQDLEHRVTTQYGDWGWRMLKGRVPDLNHPAEIKDVSLLAMNIKQAVGDLQTLESAIEAFVSAPNVASLDPMGKARNLADYQERLLERAPILADEFSPPSAGWTMACQMAGIAPSKVQTDAPVIKELVRASTRQFIQANGKLPSRMQMLEFAVLHANYMAGRPVMNVDTFSGKQDALYVKEGGELGFADFPTQTLRDKVDAYAAQTYKDLQKLLDERLATAQKLATKPTAPAWLPPSPGATEGLAKLHQQQRSLESRLEALLPPGALGPIDLSAEQPKAEDLMDGEAVMKASMQRVWGNIDAMDAGHREALAMALRAAAAECPMVPPPGNKGDSDPNLKALDRRLKDLMPGSRLFGYIASRAGDPQLGPQALNQYKRTLLELLKASWTPEDLATFKNLPADLFQNSGARSAAASSTGGRRLLSAEGLAHEVLEEAKSAYEKAQQQQLKSAQPADPQTLQVLERTLHPPLAQQLSETGAIDTFVMATQDDQKAWLDLLSRVLKRDVTLDQSGYPQQFVVDLERGDWTYETLDRPDLHRPNVVTPGSRQFLPTGTPADTTIQAHQAFFAGHARAGQALSRLLHQDGIGMLSLSWTNSSYSRGHLANGGENVLWLDQNASVDPARPNFEGGYTIRELPRGRVEVEYQRLVPATSLGFSPGDPARSIPINRGEHFDGKTTAENAALHQTFTFQFEMSDLDQGIVNPVFSRTPQTRVRFEPDWGQIAQLREKGVLSLSLT